MNIKENPVEFMQQLYDTLEENYSDEHDWSKKFVDHLSSYGITDSIQCALRDLSANIEDISLVSSVGGDEREGEYVERVFELKLTTAESVYVMANGVQ